MSGGGEKRDYLENFLAHLVASIHTCRRCTFMHQWPSASVSSILLPPSFQQGKLHKLFSHFNFWTGWYYTLYLLWICFYSSHCMLRTSLPFGTFKCPNIPSSMACVSVCAQVCAQTGVPQIIQSPTQGHSDWEFCDMKNNGTNSIILSMCALYQMWFF